MNGLIVKEVTFTGQAGRLEGRYHQSSDVNAPIALILHPHPLHGGTMNNKVVYNIFHTLAKNNFSVLRFNFRGVGKSHGSFNNGLGELIDAAAAMDWLQNQHPEASSHWVIGFSFGAWIALQLLMRRPEVDGFIVVAPPAHSYDFSFLSPCPVQGLIVHGTKDTVVSEESVYNLYERLNKQKDSAIEYVPVNNAGHFFVNEIEHLNKLIEEYLAPRIAESHRPQKVKRDRRRRQTLDVEQAS